LLFADGVGEAVALGLGPGGGGDGLEELSGDGLGDGEVVAPVNSTRR
jgi:hypothetical protein